MDRSNPDESPKDFPAVKAAKAEPAYASRARAVRGEMRRGAKLGFKVCLASCCACLAICILAGLFVSMSRGHLGQFSLELISWRMLGECLGIPVASVVFGAMPGSLIMGTVAAIHWRPPLVQHTADDTSSEGSS